MPELRPWMTHARSHDVSEALEPAARAKLLGDQRDAHFLESWSTEPLDCDILEQPTCDEISWSGREEVAATTRADARFITRSKRQNVQLHSVCS